MEIGVFLGNVLGIMAAGHLAGCMADASIGSGWDQGGAGGQSTRSEDEPASLELPLWHAYILGEDNPGRDYPPTIDFHGQVVAIREAGRFGPQKIIGLSLTDHWMMGDRYFDDRIEAGELTATDLLMITSDILAHRGELPSLPPEIDVPGVSSTRSFEGGDWNLLPGLSGSSDPHGGATAGSANPSRGGSEDAGPHVGPSHRGEGWNPATAPHGRSGKPVDRTGSHEDAYINGVRPGDPPPKGFWNSGYRPKPGERPELFRCEGDVYRGYKHACPDFQDTPDGVKWGDKLSRWQGRYFTPNNTNIAATDWEGICKTLVYAMNVLGCAGVTLACAGGEVVTLGAITLPCVAWAALICGGHSWVDSKLADKCPQIAKH